MSQTESEQRITKIRGRILMGYGRKTQAEIGYLVNLLFETFDMMSSEEQDSNCDYSSMIHGNAKEIFLALTGCIVRSAKPKKHPFENPEIEKKGKGK